MNKGLLVCISGFSGAGKGTLMKTLLNRYDQYALSISATTRAPREGELDGREYFFRTREQFEDMIQKDQFIEYASYVNNYYGTPRAYVDEMLNDGKDVILEIEIQGALNVKKKFPETLLIFVVTPSAAELERRLKGRGTETTEVIRSRLKRAAEESDAIECYDYVIVNDVLEQAAEQIHSLIQSQHHKVSQNTELITRMKRELKDREEKEL